MSKEEHFVFNEKLTAKLQEEPKFKAYKEWALQNGVIMDKVIIQVLLEQYLMLNIGIYR